MLGSLFGLSGGHAHDHVSRLLPILKKALARLGVLPENTVTDVEQIKQLIDKYGKVIIDATECRCARPSNSEQQEAYYSGKKKQHTVKSLLISDINKYIVFISLVVPGSQHDYALMKKLFDPSKPWFENVETYLDLGFLGASKEYAGKGIIKLPHKRPRKSKNTPHPALTDRQKKENKQHAALRIAVEHAIGGMKHFHCLAYKIRNHLDNLINYFFQVCAGLHNLNLLSQSMT